MSVSDNDLFLEGMQTSRYSVEVNYRTDTNEALDNFAKIILGFVSAAMKNCGYHCKTVFTDKPYRVLISTRNWDDGEWVGMACFHHQDWFFRVGKGTYNKERKTVSIEHMVKTEAKSAADIVRELRNKMEELKKETPRGSSSLNPVKLKRGPKHKSTKLKKAKGIKKFKPF